jgi:hypothetical protein
MKLVRPVAKAGRPRRATESTWRGSDERAVKPAGGAEGGTTTEEVDAGLGRRPFGLNVSAHWGTAIASSSIDPQYRPDPKTDIFMQYPRGAGDPMFGGLSGAGRWSPNLRGSGWIPRDAGLVGIQHEALGRAEGWVHATRIAHLLAAIAQRYPDVRDEVEGILSSKR